MLVFFVLVSFIFILIRITKEMAIKSETRKKTKRKSEEKKNHVHFAYWGIRLMLDIPKRHLAVCFF